MATRLIQLQPQIDEAVAMIRPALALLLASPASRVSDEAADLRRACGAVSVDAEAQIRSGTIGTTFGACVALAVEAGATIERLAAVRTLLHGSIPAGVVGQIVGATAILMCLAGEASILAGMTFTSREQVEAALTRVNEAFEPAESWAADNREANIARALLALHAAVVRDLTTRSRPLPRMVPYAFPLSMPALWLASRLYGDAARADELRLENRTPHPAFMPREGRALSA